MKPFDAVGGPHWSLHNMKSQWKFEKGLHLSVCLHSYLCDPSGRFYIPHPKQLPDRPEILHGNAELAVVDVL